VYAAWTDPAQLREWFGPENVQTRNLVAETHVGGKFRWDLTNGEGEEMTMRGEYRSYNPEGRSSLHGDGKMMRIGRGGTASLQWSYPIAMVAPRCGLRTNNYPVKNHALATLRGGRVFSINWKDFAEINRHSR
jgi:hypothetical protein